MTEFVASTATANWLARRGCAPRHAGEYVAALASFAFLFACVAGVFH